MMEARPWVGGVRPDAAGQGRGGMDAAGDREKHAGVHCGGFFHPKRHPTGVARSPLCERYYGGFA
jgi:hypothetical protein